MVPKIDYDKYKRNGAYHFRWYTDPNYAWYKECVDKVVEFCKGSTIDAGCGDGLVLEKIAENGYRVFGLDNEPSGLELCKQPTYLFDIETDHLHNETYEYLCSLNTIEHLKSPKGLIELVEQVNKGAIIITDKATGELGKYHEHEYTKEELLNTFKKFGPKYFEIESTEFGEPITFIGVEILK